MSEDSLEGEAMRLLAQHTDKAMALLLGDLSRAQDAASRGLLPQGALLELLGKCLPYLDDLQHEFRLRLSVLEARTGVKYSDKHFPPSGYTPGQVPSLADLTETVLTRLDRLERLNPET